MRSIRLPESKQATTLLVAVRCRPLTAKEQARSRDILRVIDDKVVVVLDPDVSKDYLDRIQNRSKEKQYVFDVACGTESTNKDVYDKTIGSMVEGVIQGLNATVFAYGATGSGKTHTMAGTEDDPGLMVLSLQKIFTLVASEEGKHEFEVTCSYLEVYNEVIYDLLEKSSGHLELREDPDQGITVAGLKRIQVNSAEKILELLKQGNNRRKTESTNANATSSRSHAVLEIIVRRKQRNHYRSQVLHGKLALVDLAGSERASETNNAGQKLRDGANINKSLLALANCINALGKQQKKGLAYVPYRNSKLTRLLKDGLSGNSRTVMVATVSPGGDQYHHTINTLKYADRAKEIKTHIQTNVGTVDAHVADYQRMIDNLQVEVSQLRRELAEKETILNSRAPDKSSDDELLWLDALSHGISENVEERVNLQKALFELEDMNMRNRTELQQLDELIAEYQNHVGESEISNELIEHRQIVLDNIRDNDEAGTHYRQEIELNEAQRKELQQQIDDAISRNRNQTYLRILSQYRLLGMTNMELQFQMAIRDQIIQDQREALENMWRLLKSLGLNDKQILEVASQRGVLIENGLLSPCLSAKPHLHTVTMVGASCNISKRACGARLSNLVPLPISLDADGTAESGLFKKYINGFEAKETSFVNIPSFGKMLPGFREKEGFLEGNETMKCTNAQALDCFDAKPFSQTNFTSSNNVKFLPSSPNFTDVQVSDNRTLTKASKGLAKELPSDCLQCDQKDLNLAKRIRWPPSAEQQVVECFHEATDGARDDVEEKSEIVKTSETLCKLSGYHIVEGKSKSPAEKTLLQKELLRLDTELQDLTKAREHSPQKAYFDSKILSATPCTAQRCLTPLHYDNEALTATKNNHLLKPDSCENVSGHHGTGFVQHFPSFSTFTNLSLGSGGCDTTSCNDMAVTPACLSPSKFHDEQGLLNLRHKSLAAKIHFSNVNNGSGIQPTGTCDQCCCHLIR